VAVKLAVTGAASVAVAGMFSLLVTWWAAPLDQLDSLVGPANSGRFNPLLFSQRGIAPLGYAAFAFALGATAGVILRRTVPAMAVALAGLAGALLAVANWVRPHLEPAAHLALPIMPYIKSIPFSVGDGTGPSPSRPAHGGPPQALTLAVRASQPARHGAHYYASTGGRLPNVQNAWVFSDRLVDAAGHAPSSQFLAHTACVAPGAPSNTCLAELAASLHQLVTLQPASRYWAFQAYETVIFTAAALLLAWFCFWWVRRRLA
jgi:hypothetical protein